MKTYAYIRKEVPAKLIVQLQELQQVKYDEIYVEEAALEEDKELVRLVGDILEEGDCLLVVDICAFGKNISQITKYFDLLQQKKIRLISLRNQLDTTQKMDFYKAVCLLDEMNRFYHGHKTQNALQKARENGVVGGRPAVSPKVIDKIQFLYQDKKYSIREIANQCGVSVGTVHKYIHRNMQ